MVHSCRAGNLSLMALVILLALVSCGDTTSDEKPLESDEDHFAQGHEFAQAGDFGKAVVEFETVLVEDPENVSAMSNLGVVYYNLGRLDDAIAQYQEAIELAPEDADIHSNLAAAHVQKGELDKALEEYQTAVDLNPALAEAYYGLGVVHRQKDMTEEAIRAFERFQELDAGKDPRATELAKEFLQQLKGE